MITEFVLARFGRQLRLALLLVVVVAGLALATASSQATPVTHAATAIEYGLDPVTID